jgi:hypothetical protein
MPRSLSLSIITSIHLYLSIFYIFSNRLWINGKRSTDHCHYHLLPLLFIYLFIYLFIIYKDKETLWKCTCYPKLDTVAEPGRIPLDLRTVLHLSSLVLGVCIAILHCYGFFTIMELMHMSVSRIPHEGGVYT